MSDIRMIDAGELSCLQPATLTHERLQKLVRGTAQVSVGFSTAHGNVSHLITNSCWGVTIEELSEGSSWMMLKK
jgi:phenylalanyl-tRNA synthetase beta subunit